MVAFSIGSLGTGIYLTVPGVLLLFYMTEILGVSPGLAGLAVFIPRVWDMLTDPAMGWISDRTRSPLGRRRPYLLAGAVFTSISFVFLFSAPELATERQSFIYVLAVYIASATAYTVYAVPYIAMPSEMSDDPDERSSIMAYRMTFAMVGVLAGSAAAPALVEAFGGGRAGFAGMSYVLGGACALAMLFAFFGTRRAPVVASSSHEAAERPGAFSAFKSAPFRMLALAYILQLGGLGAFTGAASYYVVYIAERGEGDLSYVFLALLAGTICSMFAWSVVGRLIGKARAYVLAAVFTLAGLSGLLVPDAPEDWVLVLICTGAVGVGFGGLQLLPFAMLTDIIQVERDAGRDAAGGFTGVWTAVEKGGLAMGPLIVGVFLSAGGFVSGAEAQSGTAVFWVRLAFAAAPALLVVASLPALLRYDALLAQVRAERRLHSVSGVRPLA